MDFILNCSCFQKCPLSSERGSYDAHSKEQLERQKRLESCEQLAKANAACRAASGAAAQEQSSTTATTITADREAGIRSCDKLVSRRLERQHRLMEKYASTNEGSIINAESSEPTNCPTDRQDKTTENEDLSGLDKTMGSLFSCSTEAATKSPPTMIQQGNSDNDDGPQTSSGLPATGPVLSSFTLEGIAELIIGNKINKSSVIVLVGAGMSTAAGVPDFRSPDTGIYANLQKYNLAHPEDVFKITYFRNNPAPFFELSRRLLPDRLYPTMSHYFVRLLWEKGYLLRCFSQNVDSLEALSGLPKEKLCLAHGSFETGHCLRCNAEYSLAWMRQIVEEGGIPHCIKTPDCKGLVKPDVKFFGERLDGRFFRLVKEDFPNCELLIIIGSSLSVMPFAQLIQKVPARCPRLLINKTKSGHSISALFRIFRPTNGLMYDRKGNIRDVAHLSDCDEACLKLADLLGWREQLLQLAHRRREELDATEEAKIGEQAKRAEKV